MSTTDPVLSFFAATLSLADQRRDLSPSIAADDYSYPPIWLLVVHGRDNPQGKDAAASVGGADEGGEPPSDILISVGKEAASTSEWMRKLDAPLFSKAPPNSDKYHDAQVRRECVARYLESCIGGEPFAVQERHHNLLSSVQEGLSTYDPEDYSHIEVSTLGPDSPEIKELDLADMLVDVVEPE